MHDRYLSYTGAQLLWECFCHAGGIQDGLQDITTIGVWLCRERVLLKKIRIWVSIGGRDYAGKRGTPLLFSPFSPTLFPPVQMRKSWLGIGKSLHNGRRNHNTAQAFDSTDAHSGSATRAVLWCWHWHVEMRAGSGHLSSFWRCLRRSRWLIRLFHV